MKRRTLSEALIGTLLCLLCLPVNGAVKLPAIISNNLVLQQNTTVNIWGEAAPQEQVSVKTSWSKSPQTTTADAAGNWSVKIKTPKAARNQSLIVSGQNTIEVKNVLIGEVWLCSGQSNMDFPVAKQTGWKKGVIDEAQELKDADYADIRLFHVAQKLSPEQELTDCEGEWLVCTPENLKDFSAVAFFFGRELENKLKQPIGLIQSTWGGTHAESWTKMEVMKNDPVYANLVADFYASKSSYPAAIEQYNKEKVLYDAQLVIAKESDQKPPTAPKKPMGIQHNKALSTLWNGMIRPLVPYTIKGVIWYQGESNGIRYSDYTHVFSTLIQSWRKEWNQGDFPFYFVQIAPHYKQTPFLREAQLNTWKSVKNTGMVVITDAADSTDIHPRNKRVPGLRLAYWALAKEYHQQIAYAGPTYQSMVVNKQQVILSFEHADQGLVAKDKPLMGFEIAGEDKQFYPATAVIKGDKVVVSAPQVGTPVAVRFGWKNFFRVNFFNGAGLPASPFRTDHWADK